MHPMKYLCIVAIMLSSLLGGSFSASAQSPLWGYSIGGPGNDVSYQVKVAPNGNVCIAGKFSGTMNLNPGGAAVNITSNGLDDIFYACYSPAGAFLWGNHIGGASYDGAMNLTIDANSDLYICGYYRGANVDFDAGAGTFLLSDAGTLGTAITYDGDGFVAKINNAGTFQWAKSLGAEYVNDCAFDVAVDGALNVYVAGFFTGTMVVSPTITWNSATTGKAYIIKYNTTGTLIWADVFGLPGTGATADLFTIVAPYRVPPISIQVLE